MTIKDMLAVLLFGAFVLFFSPANADLMECVHRGKLAAQMAQAVNEGYALDRLNFRFQRTPQNAQEQAEMEAYVDSVRAEVKALLGMEPDNLGMKVAEACAFEYGRSRGYMKDVGSAPTLSEKQITEMIMGTASSESIKGKPIGMDEACEELKHDIRTIAGATSEVSKEELAEFANRSTELSPERLARILVMIEGAYASDNLREWANQAYAECQ